MKATINFPTRAMAERFARDWSRFTLCGHSISAGTKDVSVSVYDVTDERKDWIDRYTSNINSQITK